MPVLVRPGSYLVQEDDGTHGTLEVFKSQQLPSPVELPQRTQDPGKIQYQREGGRGDGGTGVAGGGGGGGVTPFADKLLIRSSFKPHSVGVADFPPVTWSLGFRVWGFYAIREDGPITQINHHK